MKNMKTITTVLTVVMLFFTLNVVVAAQSDSTEIDVNSPYFYDFEAAQEAAAKDNKPIYIDFYTDW